MFLKKIYLYNMKSKYFLFENFSQLEVAHFASHPTIAALTAARFPMLHLATRVRPGRTRNHVVMDMFPSGCGHSSNTTCSPGMPAEMKERK